MSPTTHLLASWIIAAKTTDNPRDCRLVALAGVIPDADGLGMVADYAKEWWTHTPTQWFYYQSYHHYIMHGAFGAILTAAAMAWFARRRARVVVLTLIVFHLHLLCDLVGSRGPTPNDIWPIFYLAPFRQHPMWMWSGQWPLFGWQNAVISIALFVWAMYLALQRGDSFVGVLNRKADAVFMRVITKWSHALGLKIKPELAGRLKLDANSRN